MLKEKVEKIVRRIFIHKNEEIPAFLLHELFHQGTYLPFTTSSLKMKFLACMCNDVVVNSRRQVLEFGSGISTIILARLFRMNGLEGHITTVDESSEWQGIIQGILAKEGLESYVTFIALPTQKSPDISQSYEFDPVALKAQLGNALFDLVLIDGPSAWQPENVMSRSSNIKHLSGILGERFALFVDNTDRPGEQLLVQKIQDTFQLKPKRLDATFTTFVKGSHFNYVI